MLFYKNVILESTFVYSGASQSICCTKTSQWPKNFENLFYNSEEQRAKFFSPVTTIPNLCWKRPWQNIKLKKLFFRLQILIGRTPIFFSLKHSTFMPVIKILFAATHFWKKKKKRSKIVKCIPTNPILPYSLFSDSKFVYNFRWNQNIRISRSVYNKYGLFLFAAFQNKICVIW